MAINRHALVTRHNPPLEGFCPYSPLSVGNGGLLTAAAMMAAGWDGCDLGDAPGFPRGGTWTVAWEGLRPMP